MNQPVKLAVVVAFVANILFSFCCWASYAYDHSIIEKEINSYKDSLQETFGPEISPEMKESFQEKVKDHTLTLSFLSGTKRNWLIKLLFEVILFITFLVWSRNKGITIRRFNY